MSATSAKGREQMVALHPQGSDSRDAFGAWACVAAVVGHLVIGLWLSPEWLFSKYPDAIRLLHEGRLGGEASADYSPLYLLLNRLVSAEALRGIQAIVGAVAVWGTSRIAFHLSGTGASVVAAWLLALCAPILAYEATLEPDLLIAALEVGALWALCVPGASRRHVALAGLCLGLATALRPSGLLLVALAGAALLALRHRGRAAKVRDAALLLAVSLAVGGGLILGLRAAYGGETRATMSVGAVLHMGNRPEGTGFGANPPHLIKLVEAQTRSFDNPDAAHEIYRRFARTAREQADLGQGALEDFWVAQTLRFMRDEPGAYLGLQWRKLEAFFFGPFAHDISIVRDLSYRAAGGVAPIPVQLLGVLGLSGLLWIVLRPRRERVLLLLVFLGSHVALSVIFYVVARYQLPVLALLAVTSGALVAELPTAILKREGRWKPLTVVLALLLVLLASEAVMTSRRSVAIGRGQQGGAAARAFHEARAGGDGAAATRSFIEAHAAQPFLRYTADWRGIDLGDQELLRESVRDAIERFGLETRIDSLLAAQLLVMAGDCDHAMPLLNELGETSTAWAVYDRSVDPDLLAAECLRGEGKGDEALTRIDRALRRRPGAIDPLAQRLAASRALGDASGMERARTSLYRLHDPLSADFVLADALLAWSLPEDALAATDRTAEALPAAGVIQYQRAVALAALGRTPEALEAFDRASLLFPAHPYDVRPLEEAVRRALEADPFDPKTLSVAADYALRRGDWRTAKAHLDHASSLYGHAPTREHRLRVRLMSGLSQTR